MRILDVCGWLALAPVLFAGGTTSWEMNSYQDFIRGRFQGLSLTRDGRLIVAPKIDTLFSSDQPVVWSLAQGREGAVYAATGHRGRLYQIDKGGISRLLWTAPQPEIFALAVDPAGALYAGTSPDGKVYRIVEGKAAGYFAPGARYIWSLAIGPDGALYVGSGDQGKIFRVTSAGKGEVYYETGQSHVTSLAFDREGRLLAGSEPNGILYRVSAKDKAFVLYDANLPEIRSIVAAPDGTVYASALGGSMSKRLQGAQAAQGALSGGGATPVTTITVTADAQAGAEVKPPQPQDPNLAKPAQPAATATTTTQYSAALDVTGVEKSALYRINPDNTVETLWSSKEENIYDLLAPAGQILFSTDGNGRIYGLTPDRKVTLITQTNESEATRLLGVGDHVLAATGNLGKIYRLGDKPGTGGTYESPVHDAGGVARWGRLSWRAEGSLHFFTRSGNSLRPDKTWSDWSAPMNSVGSVSSPNARYIQWKADLSGNSILDDVTLAYIPQNLPPVVRSINVFTVAAPVSASKSSAPPVSSAYTITVTDTGDAGSAPSSGTPTQTLSRAAAQQINITWQADDPDGDRLVYGLYFRGEDEREWKLLKANQRENTYSIDGDALADGRYLFRVTASDREVNPASSAREAELVSVPVLIDNTAPVVQLSTPRRTGASVELDVEAVDAASPLRRCEYSMDAGSWTPLEADDGVIDSPRESFKVHLHAVPAGEHVLVIRAIDSAGNAGLAKVVIR